jgi:eukaryotic-like serine/threonine-protein kinase
VSEDLGHRKEVYRLLERVLTLAPEAREEILAGAPEALRSEVRELLAAENGPVTLLEGPHALVRRDADGGGPRRPERIGPYRIQGLLGAGGMGEVYLAEQLAPVRRQVALKLLRATAQGPEAEARFRTERDAMARLDHPNVGRILEAGTTDDGRPYFAMERIDGVAISEYCDREGLSLEQRVRLFVEVCRGTEHAHQKLLLHRDLKPSNILVAEVDGRPTPRIIDFGIAKVLDETLHAGGLTGDRMIGTPAYMSPEALGLGGGVDTRSDVFSLGVLLYELIAGVSPWNEEVRTPLEMLRYRSDAEPRRPSVQLTTVDPDTLREIARRRRVSVAGLAEELRGDLEWIVMKAIERAPERRYGSAAELGTDLERFLADEPVSARPPSALYVLRKAVVRHQTLVTTAALLTAALLAGVFGTSLGLVRARHAEERAQGEARAAVEARNEAREVSDFLTGLFHASSTYDPAAAKPPSQISALDLLERGSRRIDGELADQPLQAARLRMTLGEVYRSLDLLDEARRHFEAAASSLQKLAPASAPAQTLLVQVELELGQVSVKQARWDEAVGELREVRRLAGPEVAEPERTIFAARALDLESRVARRQGRFDVAESRQRESIRLWESTPGADAAELVTARSNLGAIDFDQGRWSEAESEYRRALELARRVLPPGDLRTSSVLDNLAAAVASQGRLDEAAPLFAEALKLKRQVLSDDHPAIARSLNNLGQLQLDRGHPAKAEKLHREALALRRKSLGPNHPDTAWSLDNLAHAVDAQGRTEEAWKLQEEALAIRRQALGDDHPQIARSLEHLADLARRRAQPDEAERLYREALAIRRHAGATDDPELARTAADFGELLLARDRGAEARKLFAEGLHALPAAPEGDDLKLRERLQALAAKA